MLTYPLLTLDWDMIGRKARDVKLVASVVGWQLLFTPILVWGFCWVIDPPPDFHYMMLMAAAAPPVVSVTVFSAIVRLRPELALIAVVATFLPLPVSLLILDTILPGFSIAVDLGGFAIRVALFIGLPFLIACIARRFLGPERLERGRGVISGFAMLNLIVFGIGIMDGVGLRVLQDPYYVLTVLLLAFAMNLGMQAATALAFLWRSPAEAFTLGMCAGYRNMGVMWGISGGIGGPDFFLYVGMAQIPMYVLPALAGPVYRKLMGRSADGVA